MTLLTDAEFSKEFDAICQAVQVLVAKLHVIQQMVLEARAHNLARCVEHPSTAVASAPELAAPEPGVCCGDNHAVWAKGHKP